MSTNDEELLPPFLNSFTTNLTKALHPEKSRLGAGRRALYPYGLFFVQHWPALTIGDYLGLRIGNLSVPVASLTFREEDIAGIIKDGRPHHIFEVPADKLIEGDAVPYLCRVVRAGSENESLSPVETMLIKLTVPGGHDRRPWEPWHSGLIMWVEDFLPGSIINAEVAANGLTCLIQPYLNIRQNDKLRISVDGYVVEHVVSPAEAKSTLPIRVELDEQVLLKVSKKGKVEFAFTVEDVVGNAPEGKFTYSMPVEYLSELDPLAVDSPIFLVNGGVETQLDLDEHSQSALSVEVSAVINRVVLKSPNQLHVVVETTDKLGVKATVRLPIITAKGRRVEEVPIPNNIVSTLAGGTFRVFCEYKTPAGVMLGTSSSVLIRTVGTPTMMPPIKLLAPYRGGKIPYDTDVTAEIPHYQPHYEDSLETVRCDNRPEGGSLVVPFMQIAGPQGGTRQLTKEKLKVFENKGRFSVYYETNDGKGTPGSIRKSEVLEVEIGDIVASLQKMDVPDVLDGNLDPARVTGPDVEMFIPYSGTVAGQIVEWGVRGESSLGSAGSASGSITVNPATAGITLTQLGIAVPLSVFKMNNSVSVSYSVKTPGSPPQYLFSEPLEFTVGEPVELGELKILEADPTQGTLAPRHVINGATLRISYKWMRKDDQISYKWQGQHDVSRYEGNASGDPATNTLNVPIPRSVVANGIRPDGNNITVTCEVKRGRFIYTFATLYVRLLPLAVLPTPRIRGFEHTTVLPVDQLGATANIDIAPWEFMREGQYYWVTVESIAEDGTALTTDLAVARAVTATELTKGISLALAVDQLPPLKDGSVLKIRAWVSFPAIPSKQTALPLNVAGYVVQLLPAVLPYPTLNGATSTAQDTTVDPLTIEKNTSVTVKYQGMLATDIIRLLWVFQDGTQHETTLKGLAGGSVVFDLTAAQVLHSSVNSRVQLCYSIVRSGKTTPSTVQTVMVGTIAAANLPKALINDLAPGATLALNSFAGDAKVAVGKWPLSKEGQRVNLSIVAGGRELKVLDGYVISALEATNGVADKAVSRDWIAGIANNSPIELKTLVAFDGKEIARTTQFPITNYTANTKLRPPVITQALVASSGRHIPNGGAVSASEGAATVIYGTCDARPFARYIRVGPYADGGYAFPIPAGVTSWQVWSLHYAWPSPQDYYVVEHLDTSVRSSPYRIYRK